MNNLGTIRIVAHILAVLMVISVLFHVDYVFYQSGRQLTVQGENDANPVYMQVSNSSDTVGLWKKMDYNLHGNKVSLTGMAVDAVLNNNDSHAIDDWSLQMHIHQDCFLAWTLDGEVEIHQAAGTDEEKVQRLSLQNYNLQDIKVDYLYEGELLIPLHAGDYIIYYPGNRNFELNSYDKCTSRMVFYYENGLNLSDYTLTYHMTQQFTDGPTFWAAVLISISFMISVVVFIASIFAYRQAKKNIELQRSSISSMSDIYSVIYLIGINNDILYPVSVSENTEKIRQEHIGASEQLISIFSVDTIDSYRDVVLEFMEFNHIKQRLADTNSIVCEYISKEYGWRRIRLFVMERNKANDPVRVLLTVQNIADEKQELFDIQDQVFKAESENNAKSVVLSNLSQKLRSPIKSVLDYNEKILSSTEDEQVHGYAEEIKNAGTVLLTVINELEVNENLPDASQTDDSGSEKMDKEDKVDNV